MTTATEQKKIAYLAGGKTTLAVVEAAVANKGYVVTAMPDLQTLTERVATERFALVIWECTIDELQTRRIIGPLPLIALIELQLPADVQRLAAADHALSIPFTKEELAAAIDLVTVFVEPGSKELSQDLEYSRVLIEDFISGQAVQFDIFIRLSSAKYLRIARAGDGLSIDRIRSYRSKEVNHLYLRKEDFRKYVNFNVRLAVAVAGKKSIEMQKRLTVCRHGAELILEQLYLDEVSKTSFEDSKVFVESVVSLLAEDRDLLDLLEAMRKKSPEHYFHAMSVALYAVMATSKLGWTSSITRFKLAMGGLMHDIGARDFDAVIRDGDPEKLSATDRKTLEQHPTLGVELLATIRSIPDDVLQIVVQHHETPNGTGYPAMIRGTKIHPLARIISVVDRFCELVFGPTRALPKVALEVLSNSNGGISPVVDPDGCLALLGLMRLLGVPAPDALVALEQKKMNRGATPS